MGRFTNPNGVTFSVSDDKDERYKDLAGFEPAKADKAQAKKSAPSTPSK